MNYQCRHCGNKLIDPILDLGHQPPSNAYLNRKQLDEPEITYPLKLYLCDKCWLPQLPEYAKAKELFTNDYAYFSSTSSTWCNHAKNYVKKTIDEFKLNQDSFVLEIASNDGYLLQYVKQNGIKCLGVEPTKETAIEAEKKGIDTVKEFFGKDLVTKLKDEGLVPQSGVDLLIANNVLAHVPDINDFIIGSRNILSPKGVFSVEFPHLLNLIKYNQFDTIYHEHYSYLSLSFLLRLAEKFDLHIFDTEELTTHGGSLRVWMTKDKSRTVSDSVYKIQKHETEFKIESLLPFQKLQFNAEKTKNQLLTFLLNLKKTNQLVCGYGAAAKANTLINFAGVKKDLIPFIVDNAKSKQNKFMPGSLIPIYDSQKIDQMKVSNIIVFPWNILSEISKSLQDKNIYTFIPSYKKW